MFPVRAMSALLTIRCAIRYRVLSDDEKMAMLRMRPWGGVHRHDRASHAQESRGVASEDED